MNSDVISRFVSGDMHDLEKLKPSKKALENASFYLSLFKAKKLLQQR